MQSTNPRLQAVWLLVVLPPSSHVAFLPLYPASPGSGLAQDELLESLFQLDQNGAPSAVFLSSLQTMDLWWDHYLVLDEIALAGLIELVGGVDLGQGQMNGKRTMDSLSLASQDPYNAVMLQAALARELCHCVPRLLEDRGSEVQFDLLANHMASDFSLENSQVDWDSLRKYGRSLSCKFPTLPEVSSSEPAD
ncbi:MAG: hypothetical protein JXA78_10260 [Anaerolineales bacterium]|nr:hypothetical protein [Anaerolineales bacterium]